MARTAAAAAAAAASFDVVGQLRDAKLASAFCGLEPVIRDLERAAKIAEKLFIEDPDEEEVELGRFAVS